MTEWHILFLEKCQFEDMCTACDSIVLIGDFHTLPGLSHVWYMGLAGGSQNGQVER